MKFGTQLIHSVSNIDPHTGAVSVPIYQTSTFHQENLDEPQAYDYSRSGNPTRHVLEETIAKLEGGKRGFAFATGMAAIAAVLSIFSTGDHLVVCEDVYGGTYRITTQHFSRFGLEVTFVDASNINAIQAAIQKNTKAIFLETPSNPLLKITDLKRVSALAKASGLITIIDNTFMSPYLQRPLALGIDIIIHSATKSIGGHSDVIAGLVVVEDIKLAQQVYAIQNSFGAVLGPQDSWLLLRGLKTLKVRLDCQQAQAQKLAQWLQQQPKVSHVYYPGLENHPNREIHFGQASGPGVVLSFKAADEATARHFMSRVKLAAVAVSLGGVETIVSYPVKMSHASMPPLERQRLGITDALIRVSVGLEDVEDLIEDFSQALD
jgi:cystathionine beta-lyase/cystathionine gamma-synthase